MFAGDTGYFEYDDQYAPLCIKPSSISINNNIDMSSIIQDYYNDTHTYGKKHAWAIQPSGITAAEAAFLVMKGRVNLRMPYPPPQTQTRRRRDKHSYSISEQEVSQCTQSIVTFLQEALHMNDNHTSVLRHVLRLPTQHSHDIVQRVLQQVKQFIKQYNLMTKRYTKVLKECRPQLMAIIDKYYDRKVKSG